MTRLSIPALVLVALSFAACGGSSGGGSSSTGPSSPSGASGAARSSGAVKVVIASFKYAPETITVKAGTKVTWTNQDSAEHTATSQDHTTFDTGTLAQGQSKTITLTKPGTYRYTCTFHPFMHGTVVVK